MKEENIFAREAYWYILHTHSGYEQRVEKAIRELMRTEKDGQMIEDVLVPTEKVVDIVNGVKKTSIRKFYPGYVMVKMKMTDVSWNMIQSLSRVISFMGSKNHPVPMKPSEVERVFAAMDDDSDIRKQRINFNVNDKIQILEGPFSGFFGIVEEVNVEKGKLWVSVSIFGRQTPVELDFNQVIKE